ncbi:VCBS domain-containing protein [Roseomonas tokyonensis]|nr:VCBS domain-containing protein [Falsiroseomonas tokyonensis]
MVEDASLVANGNVLWNDSDADGDTLSVTAVNGQAAGVGATILGIYGTLLLGADGQYSYTLANDQANVRALAAGQTVTETFRYTLSDGQPHFVPRPSPWQNLISQSQAFDNAAWSRFSVPGTLPAVAAHVAADPFGTNLGADRLALAGIASGIYYTRPSPGSTASASGCAWSVAAARSASTTTTASPRPCDPPPPPANGSASPGPSPATLPWCTTSIRPRRAFSRSGAHS